MIRHRLSVYTVSSVLTTVFNVSVMALLLVWGLAPWAANALTLILEVPLAYFLARRVVWRDRPQTSARRDLAVFYGMYAANLVVASAVLAIFEPSARPVVLLEQWAVFAVLWVVQYVVIDRVLIPPASS